jgi:hypothetical protein
MRTQQVFGATAAAVLTLGVAAFAQTTEQRKVDTPETQVTLVGCIQREADYRRATDAGKGGPLGTGLRLGNEFVLVTSPGGDGDCATAGTGEAYELTGNRERELEGFVGRRVEITGMQKEAETVAGRPTGGVDPLGQDLELFEVEVSSFSEVAATRQAQATAQADQRVESEPQPLGTAGAQEALPRTASPLPIAGLIGLLSFAGALGLRSLRRR